MLHASGHKPTAKELNQEESYPMGKSVYNCLLRAFISSSKALVLGTERRGVNMGERFVSQFLSFGYT